MSRVNAVRFLRALAVLVLMNSPTWSRSLLAETVGIHGRVTDSLGDPLATTHVEVRTCDGTVRSAVTGSDGSYELGEAEIGCELVISVRREGFDAKVLRVIAGTYGTHLDIGLDATLMFSTSPQLTGRVLDRSARRVVDATVTVQAAVGEHRLHVRSGRAGEFVTHVVQPGAYIVTVVKSGYAVSARVVTVDALKAPSPIEVRLHPRRD